MPDPTTTPVAAEGLRERLTETLNTTLVMQDDSLQRATTKWDRHDRHNFLSCCAVCQGNIPAIVTAVLAALAGDSGEDLPALTAEAIRAEFNKTAIVCEHTQVISFGALAAAALSVRCEVHAATVAENAELRRREEHAVKEHQVTRERLAEARREVAELRRTPLAAEEEIRRLRAGLVTESRAADDVIADLEELIKTERQQHEATLAEVERLQAELAEAKRELEATHVRAKTAVKRRNDVKAERDALKAAISDVLCRMATTRAWAYRELSGAALSNVQLVIDHLWGILDPARSIHPALAVPETPGDAADER
jgi:hypothetical protein